jgi:hypothetical protein
MRSFVATLAVVLSVTLVASAAAGPSPSLVALKGTSKLTLLGRGFSPGDRVALTVFAGTLRKMKVVVRSNGTFVVRLPIKSGTCLAWRATAVGSRSGQVTLRAPTVDCRPEVGVPPTVGTGIAGIVRRGPTRPVCVAELPCSGPAPGVVVEIVGGESAVARAVTNADGRFVVQVPPGEYTVRVNERRVDPVEVRVHADAFSTVSLLIDTGIR